MATIVNRNDKWQAKIRRDGYPTRSKTFLKYSDAESWARQQESEMDRGVWHDRTASEQMTFGELLDRYAKEVSIHKKSVQTDLYHIATFKKDDMAKLKLSAFNRVVLADWRDRRIEYVVGDTVNRELNTISAAINWARKDLGIYMDNPVSLIRRPPKSPGRDRRFEEDEEKRLLEQLTDHADEEEGKPKYRRGTRNKLIKPFAEMAIETAMRRGELLSLLWENIDLKAQTAFLPGLATKNGRARTVPLSLKACSILDGLRRAQIDETDGADQPMKPLAGRVFKLTKDAVKAAFNRARERAKLEDFNFHDLRHEAASRLAEKLPNVIELSSVTGHRDLKMLQRYYHPRAEDLAKKLG